jgi:hypothetical protein
LIRIRELLQDLQTNQDTLTNYVASYIVCMVQVASCDEVSEQLDRAKRRPGKVLDPDYWSDVRKQLENIRPLIPELECLPGEADFSDSVKAFDMALAGTSALLNNPSRDRRELLTLRDRMSEQIASLRRITRHIGSLYQQEVVKVQQAIKSALDKINERMSMEVDEVQTEGFQADTNPTLGKTTRIPRPMRPVAIEKPNKEAIDPIRELMADQAQTGAQGPAVWFRNLISKSDLPDSWKRDLTNPYVGSAGDMARWYIEWLLSKGRNPQKPECTALATVLVVFLEDVGVDECRLILSFIEMYGQITEPQIVVELRKKYCGKE